MKADFGVKAIYSPADMTRPAEIAEMISFSEKTFGSVDILVNNAGIQFVAKPLALADDDPSVLKGARRLLKQHGFDTVYRSTPRRP